MTKVEIDCARINGEEVSLQGENALCIKDHCEIFVNLDPIYSVKIPKQFEGSTQLEIVIEGKVTRLTDEEINQVVNQNMYEIRDQLREYEENLEILKSENDEVRTQLNTLENTWVYRLYAKFSKKNMKE